MNLERVNQEEEGGTRWWWWWVYLDLKGGRGGDREKGKESPCGSLTCTGVLTYTFLLGLPNEILMGNLGSAGARLAEGVGGWGWGVGGVGGGSVTAASCGSGHLCHSGSPSDSPSLI